MGFFLDGFLGERTRLEQWPATLPGAVVCPLDGDLALVPITGRLERDLVMGARAWALDASKAGPVVHFSIGEFGDRSHEEVALWSQGGLVAPSPSLRAALEYLRTTAALRFDAARIDLEKYRSETAAEKWAAAAMAPRDPEHT